MYCAMSNLMTVQDIADWPFTDQMGPADERVSIWDIRRGWRDRFWIVFSFQAVLAAAFGSWFELQFGNEPTAWHQARSIISNTMPYIVLVGPSSYLITEVSVLLSERYIEWKQKKGRVALAGWLTRRQQAWERGGRFEEPLPDAVDWRTEQANLRLILAHPRTLSDERKGDRLDDADLDARERRVLEVESWYGRKRLAEDRGEPFNEPYPSGNGMPRS